MALAAHSSPNGLKFSRKKRPFPNPTSTTSAASSATPRRSNTIPPARPSPSRPKPSNRAGKKGSPTSISAANSSGNTKGRTKIWTKAYQQLQLYREDLQNPPLLITSDIHTIIIHTNFNNYPTVSHTITFDDILDGRRRGKTALGLLRPAKVHAGQDAGTNHQSHGRHLPERRQ